MTDRQDNVGMVMRQTTYSEAEAEAKLAAHNGEVQSVLREFFGLGTSSSTTNATTNRSVNQQIYREIRRHMSVTPPDFVLSTSGGEEKKQD